MDRCPLWGPKGAGREHSCEAPVKLEQAVREEKTLGDAKAKGGEKVCCAAGGSRPMQQVPGRKCSVGDQAKYAVISRENGRKRRRKHPSSGKDSTSISAGPRITRHAHYLPDAVA